MGGLVVAPMPSAMTDPPATRAPSGRLVPTACTAFDLCSCNWFAGDIATASVIAGQSATLLFAYTWPTQPTAASTGQKRFVSNAPDSASGKGRPMAAAGRLRYDARAELCCEPCAKPKDILCSMWATHQGGWRRADGPRELQRWHTESLDSSSLQDKPREKREGNATTTYIVGTP